jgi:hypothetical protein
MQALNLLDATRGVRVFTLLRLQSQYKYAFLVRRRDSPSWHRGSFRKRRGHLTPTLARTKHFLRQFKGLFARMHSLYASGNLSNLVESKNSVTLPNSGTIMLNGYSDFCFELSFLKN